MTFTLRISARALDDAESIHRWIADNSPEAALRWYEVFWQTAQSLPQMADLCGLALESEAVGFPVRERFFRTPRGRRYRILFTIREDNIIRVLRVRGPGQPPLEEGET